MRALVVVDDSGRVGRPLCDCGLHQQQKKTTGGGEVRKKTWMHVCAVRALRVCVVCVRCALRACVLCVSVCVCVSVCKERALMGRAAGLRLVEANQ